jgi:hypothetical protein
MDKFIVIEKMNPDFPMIVTDEEGKPKIFDDWNFAEMEVDDCQDGQIVEI